MRLHLSLLSQSTRTFEILGLGMLLLVSAHAQTATAPTASKDPAAIDQEWQKAVSEYDSSRAARALDLPPKLEG